MDKDLETAFLNELDACKDKLFRICSSYSNNAEDAKDLFQEVLINIWKALPSFNNKSALSTWMFRITLNVNLRHRANLQREKKRISELKGFHIEFVAPENPTDPNLQKLDLLRKCVRLLNEADKAIITLYLESLPYIEISEITGLKENTIAVRVKRIKKKLLNCINKGL